MFDKYFKLLELNNDATMDEIKKAYKKLAIKYHPDKNTDNKEIAEKKFKEISEAYEILTNKDKYVNNPQFRENFMPQFNPHELFNQLFSQLNNHRAHPFNNSAFMGMGLGNFNGIHVVEIPNNPVMRTTSTRIENGKKIVTITEKINGRTSVKTVTSNINSPDLINIMQQINIG